MGRRTTRGRGRRQRDASGPSLFFIVALAIGLILLIVMAVVIINRPPTKQGALPASSIARVV